MNKVITKYCESPSISEIALAIKVFAINCAKRKWLTRCFINTWVFVWQRDVFLFVCKCKDYPAATADTPIPGIVQNKEAMSNINKIKYAMCCWLRHWREKWASNPHPAVCLVLIISKNYHSQFTVLYWSLVSLGRCNIAVTLAVSC